MTKINYSTSKERIPYAIASSPRRHKYLSLQLFIGATLTFCFITVMLHIYLPPPQPDEKYLYNRQQRFKPRNEPTGHNESSTYDDHSLSQKYFQSVRRSRPQSVQYQTHKHLTYNVTNCPSIPPKDYPFEWYILSDILKYWNVDTTSIPSKIHQGLCMFNHHTEYHKAKTYREAELPFILTNDPEIVKVSKRWNQPQYLSNVLGKNKTYRTEYSESNHFMYFNRHRLGKSHHDNKNWIAPILDMQFTYNQWLQKATYEYIHPNDPHYYFRVNAKNTTDNLYNELPFFRPIKNFYMIDPNEARGINCRFGMTGNLAEMHFDSSRNFIVMLGGERRYILSHPKNCPNLALYPYNHPSGRHSMINWSYPELDISKHPEIIQAKGNEVILGTGEALYLPTNWFHLIISLGLNWQCNARSGHTSHYNSEIHECGFG